MAEESGAVARRRSISRKSSPVASPGDADDSIMVFGEGASAAWVVTGGKSPNDFKMFVFFMRQ
jgi:hypothetical protein